MQLCTTDVVTRDLGDEVVILNMRTSRYLTVTGVGIRLIELLADDRTEEDLVKVILDEYEVERAVAERDVSAFVAQVRAAELLER